MFVNCRSAKSERCRVAKQRFGRRRRCRRCRLAEIQTTAVAKSRPLSINRCCRHRLTRLTTSPKSHGDKNEKRNIQRTRRPTAHTNDERRTMIDRSTCGGGAGQRNSEATEPNVRIAVPKHQRKVGNRNLGNRKLIGDSTRRIVHDREMQRQTNIDLIIDDQRPTWQFPASRIG